MYITNKQLSRRTVLKGVGVTMALPFLEAMVPARSVFDGDGARPVPPVAASGDTAVSVALSVIGSPSVSKP